MEAIKARPGVWQHTKILLEMVKFPHTIFALPLAFMSALLAEAPGLPPMGKLFWILVAMIGARNGAMAFNRLVDVRYDARNPRTSNRALPSGKLSRWQVWLFIIACILLFEVAAYMLNPLALALSPLALFIIFAYSYTKRFTAASHIFLGISLGLAPIGAWIGITGDVDTVPILLGAATIFWVAGFDIIYSCQDADFDRQVGLCSIPQKLGLGWALFLSATFHLITIGLLIGVKFAAGLGGYYTLGLVIVAILLCYEHLVVTPGDLSRVNQAFAMVNGWVSVVLLVATMLDCFC